MITFLALFTMWAGIWIGPDFAIETLQSGEAQIQWKDGNVANIQFVTIHTARDLSQVATGVVVNSTDFQKASDGDIVLLNPMDKNIMILHPGYMYRWDAQICNYQYNRIPRQPAYPC